MATKTIYLILLTAILSVRDQAIHASLPSSQTEILSGSPEGQKLCAQFRKYEWLAKDHPSDPKKAKKIHQELAGLRAFGQRLESIIELQNLSYYLSTTTGLCSSLDKQMYTEPAFEQLQALQAKVRNILDRHTPKNPELLEPQRQITHTPTALVAALIHTVILPGGHDYDQRLRLTGQLLEEFANPSQLNEQFPKADRTRLAFYSTQIQSILHAHNSTSSSCSSSSSTMSSSDVSGLLEASAPLTIIPPSTDPLTTSEEETVTFTSDGADFQHLDDIPYQPLPDKDSSQEPTDQLIEKGILTRSSSSLRAPSEASSWFPFWRSKTND